MFYNNDFFSPVSSRPGWLSQSEQQSIQPCIFLEIPHGFLYSVRTHCTQLSVLWDRPHGFLVLRGNSIYNYVSCKSTWMSCILRGNRYCVSTCVSCVLRRNRVYNSLFYKKDPHGCSVDSLFCKKVREKKVKGFLCLHGFVYFLRSPHEFLAFSEGREYTTNSVFCEAWVGVCWWRVPWFIMVFVWEMFHI